MQVGLSHGHTVLDGGPAPPPPKGHSPQFSAHICCGQMAGWIKMPLDTEVGLSSGHIVLHGDPATPTKMGEEEAQSPPQFSAFVYCGQTAGCIPHKHIAICRKKTRNVCRCPTWWPNSAQLGFTPTIPQSYIRVRAVVCECGKGQTDTKIHRWSWPLYVSLRLCLARDVTRPRWLYVWNVHNAVFGSKRWAICDSVRLRNCYMMFSLN